MMTPYDKLAKIYTNCYGDMTKMAEMLLYGTKFQKSRLTFQPRSLILESHQYVKT